MLHMPTVLYLCNDGLQLHLYRSSLTADIGIAYYYSYHYYRSYLHRLLLLL